MEVPAFGTYAPSGSVSDATRTYYAEAGKAVQDWLRDRGFAPTPVVTPNTDIQPAAEAWYSGSHEGSSPFVVKLVFGHKDQVGLGARLVYESHAPIWKTPRDTGRFLAFAQLLSQWRIDYGQQHPLR